MIELVESEAPLMSEDATVAKWEARLRESRAVPVEGQDELRPLLRSVDQHIRERAVQLLNPRRSPMVELSDADLQERYSVTTPDNYDSPFGYWDKMAFFDAAHGYYVQVEVRPLRRGPPSSGA